MRQHPLSVFHSYFTTNSAKNAKNMKRFTNFPFCHSQCVYDVQSNKAASLSHWSKIYSCWFEPQSLDVTACRLCPFSCYHTHTHTPALLLHADSWSTDVWAWSLTEWLEHDRTVECNKAIPSARRGIQNVSLLPDNIFQSVWSMLVRHMQYCIFAMWMVMQSHQPLYCVCNIISFNAGWLVSSHK